jgi:hypothetical protein
VAVEAVEHRARAMSKARLSVRLVREHRLDSLRVVIVAVGGAARVALERGAEHGHHRLGRSIVTSRSFSRPSFRP